jgi:pyruvate,water dikinase
MASTTPFIEWFSDISMRDRPVVGGKGASLGELTREQIRVPPGFVVTTAGFREFLAEVDPDGAICRDIEALDAADLQGIASTTRRIRSLIEDAKVTDGIILAIADNYGKLCGGDADLPVAVRSSATSEDSEEASFAGLQDTLLWVFGAESIVHAVRKCWASLYNPESVGYRRRLKLPEQDIAMAVVVQRMVDSLCSGVMFTRSPTTGDRSVVAIEGSWGLGSCIVSGEVTPDKYIVNKVTGEINKRFVSVKTLQHRPDMQAGGIIDEAVPEDRQSLPCIDDAAIHELVRIAKQVERHYGSPQDIEWAIERNGTFPGNIYLLQSRPETVWAGKDREAKPLAAPKAKAFDHVISLLGGKK